MGGSVEMGLGVQGLAIKINTGILETMGEQCLAVDDEQASASKVTDDIDLDRVDRRTPLSELGHFRCQSGS